MQNKTEFIREIESITLEVQQELDKRKAGIKGDGNVFQLELALDELREVKESIINNKRPAKVKRRLQIPWFITDSWSPGSVLGNHLISIAHRYEEMWK